MNSKSVQKTTTGQLPNGLHRQDSTLLAVDISRFIQLTRTLKPDNIITFLNDFYNFCSDHVQANNGVIAKYTGDGCIARYNVEASLAAISTAVKMRNAFPQFCQSHNLEATDLKLRIDTGEVVHGLFGPEQYPDILGAVVGQVLTLAAPGITISERIYRKMASTERSPWKKQSSQVVYYLP